MSSSMRNAIQRRSHRERAQPLERKRLGLLEKHKDYSLRAKDWNKKKAALKNLREKAADRNEDEFYHKMLSRSGPGSALLRGSEEKRARHWNGTVEGDRGNKSMSVDVVRLLKSQDAGYLRTMRNVAAKEVRALEQRVVIAQSFAGPTKAAAEADEDEDEDEDEELSQAAKKALRRVKTAGTKTVFADSAEERDMVLDADDADDADDKESEDTQRKADTIARLQKRLASARTRLAALTEAEQELELQRSRMAKTATADMIQKSGKRIKVRERKR